MCNGQRWIRTTEAICSRFTVCPLWPLGNLPIYTIWNCIKADDRTRTDNLLITNQLLCQLSHIGIHNKYFIFSDSDGNRTRVTAVKGRCLNRLTMEPYIYLSLCFSHDRDLIYHRLGCLASVFLNFLKNFYFSDFFLSFADSKSFTCFSVRISSGS